MLGKRYLGKYSNARKGWKSFIWICEKDDLRIQRNVWRLLIFKGVFVSLFVWWYELIVSSLLSEVLLEKCPNTEFFLVCIFLYSNWIRRFTEKFSVFSPYTGEYGSEKTPYLDTFHTVLSKETWNRNNDQIGSEKCWV